MDEEEDQGSSWESELEGEKAEDLASLGAPDHVVLDQEQKNHQMEKANGPKTSIARC